MITNRDRKYVGLALKESALSTYTRVRIGSVIVQSGKIVGKGANLATSHPQQKRYNNLAKRVAPAHALHSELHAIIRVKRESLVGSHIYIARLDRCGIWADSRPCPACSLAIKLAGISLVSYTSRSGIHTILSEDL